MRTCPKCGAERDITVRDCRPCAVARARRWAAANPERMRANQSRSQQQRRAQVPPVPRRPGRSPEEASAAAVARAKAWGQANPERRKQHARLAAARRYALTRGATAARITADQLDARLSMWAHRCWVCRADADQVDHVKPLAKGGPHLLANLRPICGTCNRRKAARWPLTERTAAA